MDSDEYAHKLWTFALFHLTLELPQQSNRRPPIAKE